MLYAHKLSKPSWKPPIYISITEQNFIWIGNDIRFQDGGRSAVLDLMEAYLHHAENVIGSFFIDVHNLVGIDSLVLVT